MSDAFLFLIIGCGLLSAGPLWDVLKVESGLPTDDTKVGRRSFWGAALFVGSVALVFVFGQEPLGLDPLISGIASRVFCVMAVAYFAYVILFTLYLSARDRNFDANAIMLARNTAISVFMTVATFAAVYSHLGLVPPGCNCNGGGAASGWDHIYFSMVTFSTLGFGDFTPTPGARLYAGGQAILGNLHLGIFVGIALIAIKGRD